MGGVGWKLGILGRSTPGFLENLRHGSLWIFGPQLLNCFFFPEPFWFNYGDWFPPAGLNLSCYRLLCAVAPGTRLQIAGRPLRTSIDLFRRLVGNSWISGGSFFLCWCSVGAIRHSCIRARSFLFLRGVGVSHGERIGLPEGMWLCSGGPLRSATRLGVWLGRKGGIGWWVRGENVYLELCIFFIRDFIIICSLAESNCRNTVAGSIPQFEN